MKVVTGPTKIREVDYTLKSPSRHIFKPYFHFNYIG